MFKHSAKISFVQNVRKQVYPLKIENVEKATNILRFRYMYILLTFLLRGMYIFVLKPHKVKKRTDSNMIYLIQLGWQGCAPWSSKHRCLRPVSTCERCDHFFEQNFHIIDQKENEAILLARSDVMSARLEKKVEMRAIFFSKPAWRNLFSKRKSSK